MKISKYPHLTQKERAQQYNRDFRKRKKLDPEYQERLRQYRRHRLKIDYNKMKEEQPEKFIEHSHEHSEYASKARKRMIERGEGYKIKERDHRYQTKNKQHLSIQRAQYRKMIKAQFPVRYLLSSAKSRATSRNIDFALKESHLIYTGICPVFNIPITTQNTKLQDNSATIDRIDPSKGYVPGNVHIISWRANTLKKDATPQELKQLAMYFASHLFTSTV